MLLRMLHVYVHTSHSNNTLLYNVSPSLSPSSPFQDDFVVLHVSNEYDTVLETPLKTEFRYELMAWKGEGVF